MNHNAPIDPAKLPKTLRPLAARITDFEDDRGNQNGYWVHLAAGWFSDFSETHIIHEDTLADCRYYVRAARRCICRDCRPDLNAEVKERKLSLDKTQRAYVN